MHVKFAELPVKDQDRALAFYRDHLGMTVAKDASYGGDWRWMELAMAGAQTKIVMSRSTSAGRPESPTLVLAVDDVHALHSRLATSGVDIKQPPKAASWDQAEVSSMFYDSEDNLILITSSR